jgi:hypothetical protein
MDLSGMLGEAGMTTALIVYYSPANPWWWVHHRALLVAFDDQLSQLLMPEVKTKTFCAPAFGGPLHGRIVLRANRQGFSLRYQEMNPAGVWSTHVYALMPSQYVDEQDARFEQYWSYQGILKEKA